MREGTIVIAPTGQAGTISQLSGTTAHVLLTNGEMWVGDVVRLILPQNAEHLAACPVNVSRPEPKRKKAKGFVSSDFS